MPLGRFSNLVTRRTMSTHERLIRSLVDSLREGKEPPVTAEEGRKPCG